MALFDGNKTLKRLRNRYRLVIMNDDTYEEVITFKLTRLSVYIALSTIFVVLVGLTVALITFTNLKYYLPGYGTQTQRREFIQLRMRTDSLANEIRLEDQYLDGLKKVFSGDLAVKKDTAVLKVPQVEKSDD